MKNVGHEGAEYVGFHMTLGDIYRKTEDNNMALEQYRQALAIYRDQQDNNQQLSQQKIAELKKTAPELFEAAD